MKKQEVINALYEAHGIEFEDEYSTSVKFRGRLYRVFDQSLDISDKDFDRWANSSENEIEFTRMKTKRFLRDFDSLTL